ncbi:hypothetical protein C8D93_10531 [Sinimarinibacterium flocculans]|uniref:Uncharacterized protein n=1 Tax=Sinimarinibacterium flocculans TaxID=985250 RepID=A0A318E7K9_9GAMM|nr:hypothetical protein C8D93_10531 [Sinimarinibacterium flocculans]
MSLGYLRRVSPEEESTLDKLHNYMNRLLPNITLSFLDDIEPSLREAAHRYWHFSIRSQSLVFHETVPALAAAFGFEREYDLRVALAKNSTALCDPLPGCDQHAPFAIRSRSELVVTVRDQICPTCRSSRQKREIERRMEEARIERERELLLELNKRLEAKAVHGAAREIELNAHISNPWLLLLLYSWLQSSVAPNDPAFPLARSYEVLQEIRRQLLNAGLVTIDLDASPLCSFELNAGRLTFNPADVVLRSSPLTILGTPVSGDHAGLEGFGYWLRELFEGHWDDLVIQSIALAVTDYFFADCKAHHLRLHPAYDQIYPSVLRLTQFYGFGIATASAFRVVRRAVSWTAKGQAYPKVVAGTMVKWLAEFVDKPETANFNPFTLELKHRIGVLTAIGDLRGIPLSQLSGIRSSTTRETPAASSHNKW